MERHGAHAVGDNMTISDHDSLDPRLRREAMIATFRQLHKAAPSYGARAPGRVDLMGSHTDYNEGCVMTLPIDRDTWIVGAPRDDHEVHVTSLNLGATTSFDPSRPDREPSAGWGRYLHGVAAVLTEAGHPIRGCNTVVHGTVPLGSGLSSSASLEAAAATLFEQLGGFTLDPVEKAKLTQRAENEWVGVHCGILDQYSVILGEQGHALMLDCRSLTHTHAAVPAGLRIVICNTCAPRALSGSEYGERRSQCEEAAAFFARRSPGVRALRDVTVGMFRQHASGLPPELAKRSRFIIEENERVRALAEAFARDDRAAIRDLASASFAGARDLFEISVPAMESMFEAMRIAPGCIGCRQAGAGFGGCMIAVVDDGLVEAFCRAAAAAYLADTGIVPEIYPIRAAAGAGALRLS